MSDKFRDLSPVNVTYSAGEQPTASKLTGWANQIALGLSKLEQVIGDAWSDGHPLFGDANTPVGGWGYTNSGTTIGTEQRHLQILNLARLVGPASALNPRVLSDHTVTLTEVVPGKQNAFHTRYRPISNVSLSETVIGVFTGTVTEPNVHRFGNYNVDTTLGRVLYIGTDDDEMGTITYDVDISAVNGVDSYEDASFNVIPDPNQATKCTVTGPASGKYTIAFPVITSQQGNWHNTSAVLESDEDPNYNHQLYLPEYFGTEFTSGVTIPDGLVKIWDGESSSFLEGQIFYYLSQSSIQVDDSITLETGSDRYSIVVAGTDITRTLDNLRTRFNRHEHTGEDGTFPIDHKDVSGKARGSLTIPDKDGGNDLVIGWLPSHAQIAFNDHPQYLHRVGMDGSNLKNAMFGDILFAPTQWDETNDDIFYSVADPLETVSSYGVRFLDSSAGPRVYGEIVGALFGTDTVRLVAEGPVVKIESTGSITDGLNLRSTTRINLDNTGQSTYSINTDSGKDINLTAAEDIVGTAIGDVTITAGDDLTLVAPDILFTGTTGITGSAPNILFTATTGDIFVAGNDDAHVIATNGDVEITAGGDINLTPGGSISSDIVHIVGARLELDSGTNIHWDNAIAGTAISHETSTDSIHIRGASGLGPDFPVQALSIQENASGTGSVDYVVSIYNTQNTSTGDPVKILRFIMNGEGDSGDDFIRAHDEDGADLEWHIDGDGVFSDTFTGQHWVVYQAAPGILMQNEIMPGMIVESTGTVWNAAASTVSEALPIVHRCSTAMSKTVYGVHSHTAEKDIDNGRWNSFPNAFHPASMIPLVPIAADLVWNGTTTITTTDTSELQMRSIIKFGQYSRPQFFVQEIIENTSITISNPKNFLIPTGSGAGSSYLISNDSFDPAGADYHPASTYFKSQVNSVGEGKVWVTDINGDVENGDYVTSSIVPGYGQKQSDDILHNYTVAKCVEAVDWNLVVDTVIHLGTPYKRALVACTYHCG